MSGVDVADQIRSYYKTQRTHRRTWKPLWYFLVDTTVCNCFKLANSSRIKPCTDQWESIPHKDFRRKLANQLFEASERPPRTKALDTALALKVRHLPHRHHPQIVRLVGEKKNCGACVHYGRKAVQGRKRKVFAELSPNTTMGGNKRREQYPRSVYGCDYCLLHLCNYGNCFQEHLDEVNKIS